MRCVALIPAVALIVGVVCGTTWPSSQVVDQGIPVVWACACFAWWADRPRATVWLLVVGFTVCGVAIGARAVQEALEPPLRAVLDAAFGGFSIGSMGPAGVHPPQLVRGRLTEDASLRDGFASMRIAVESVSIDGRPRVASGGVLLTIDGALHSTHVGVWRAGRTLTMPVTFRRPARYLNRGVRDFERDLALNGTALIGTVKSALLVEVVAHGTAFQEAAATLRARVRREVARHVGGREPVRAGIVTAILIGDRTGLPDEVRERLQSAGTYHVIAISGGNIAILAGLLLGAISVTGAGPRRAGVFVVAGLVAYAAAVTSGPSVWRATLTAVVYLSARWFDHRSPPWNAMAVSAGILTCAGPLQVWDAGFVLTFGATAAILEVARRVRRSPHVARSLAWCVAVPAASLGVEIVLLPVTAAAFSRVTAAGLVLNLAAIPLMTVTQVCGLVVAAGIDPLAVPAGWVADKAAGALIESTRLVDMATWMSRRVPSPPTLLLAAYYVGLAVSLLGSGWIKKSAILLTACLGVMIVSGLPRSDSLKPGMLRLTTFDVGQGDAMLIEAPDGSSFMVDTGGIGFGSSTFDVGGRVLAPALWARGVRRLHLLALTHAHPDHTGGAVRIVRDFRPGAVWEGIRIPGDRTLASIAATAEGRGLRLEQRFSGAEATLGPVRLRILHPSAPDWERQRARNADSLVIELTFGRVAMLLTGDIEADEERAILSRLTHAPIRVLKVAHHGSRTSTSLELVSAWSPTVAVISCGRGNPFGHPHPAVLQRLEATGATILRTDRQGQITLETDGTKLMTRTFVNSP